MEHISVKGPDGIHVVIHINARDELETIGILARAGYKPA